MRYFKSDNTAAVCAPILAALTAANQGAALAYGADEWSQRLDAVAGEFFGAPVRVFTVISGTAANALALATLCPPWGTVLTHREAHIERDECGAPEFYTGGAKLSLIEGGRAKISESALIERLGWFDSHVHGVQPKALSITQATERGAIYSPEEIGALADVAHRRGLAVHVDGARLANAIVALGCHPGDVTWRAGVDVLSLGVIKNGGMNAEAVVFFSAGAAAPMFATAEVSEFEFRRKRGGHLVCKGRYMAAQILAYLESGVWRTNAAHANRLAQRIGVAAGPRLTAPVETNQVFVKLGVERIAALLKAGFAFYPWGPLEAGEARFVVSWDTSEEDVDALCAALAAA
ncbi:MAG TPA: beta-eliminating lyase-related protein [Steroidobacteraceae bacterium]|nr:beta-eliminating lyase-related protein [Steroidobacteraceae bacterium]HRX88137.1 beta-eliminating lyase-related protein [Steroidobacteraceae bacterium]